MSVRVIAMLEVVWEDDPRPPAELGASLLPLLKAADLGGGEAKVCYAISAYTEPVPQPQPPDGF